MSPAPDPRDYAKVDPEWVESRTGETAQVVLAKHRTHLAEHRTGLSGKRTDLSVLRSHLSNERTHLSYLRTAVSLIGFGITLNRFSIFLQMDEHLAPSESRLLLRDTGNVGAGMAVLGIVLLIWSLQRYWVVSKEIEAASFVPRYRAVTVLTVGLLVLGGASAIWLFLL